MVFESSSSKSWKLNRSCAVGLPLQNSPSTASTSWTFTFCVCGGACRTNRVRLCEQPRPVALSQATDLSLVTIHEVVEYGERKGEELPLSNDRQVCEHLDKGASIYDLEALSLGVVGTPLDAVQRPPRILFLALDGEVLLVGIVLSWHAVSTTHGGSRGDLVVPLTACL